ncbi:ROK family protein [Kribbella sp. NPDC051770]|uniref:ROK family protein n=1 Tax=Kribbella sp. NPDC051770 TaxID=3155413 RepID=UPI00342584A7
MPQPSVLALDVGGTKLAAGVVAADGTVHSFRSVGTGVGDGPDLVVGRLLDLAEKVLADAGHPEIAAAGIGCGGPLDPVSGVILGPPGLPGWDEVPLAQWVTDRLGVPAYVENDATAAALAEYRWGGWDVSSLVYLTVSTGFGGGVVTNGTLFQGAAGQGGELGHVVVDWQGRLCGCGARGCAEAYVSGTSIARRAAEALEAQARASARGGLGEWVTPAPEGPGAQSSSAPSGAEEPRAHGTTASGTVDGLDGRGTPAPGGPGAAPGGAGGLGAAPGGAGGLGAAPGGAGGLGGWGASLSSPLGENLEGVSALASVGEITARDVVEHARAGDELARAVWDETTAMLGRMVAVIINVCEPELVVLGGGVTRAGEFLLTPVREAALGQAMGPAARVCEVVLSRHGDRSGVLGAAAIALHRGGAG